MTSVDDTVDLTNCDREAIHLISSVQSFGFLIAVTNHAWVITHASRSVTERLGRTPHDIIGQPLQAVFSEEAIHSIRTQLRDAVLGDMVARLFDVELADDAPRCDLAIHLVDKTIVIECEPCITESSDNTGLMVRDMIARLQKAPDLRAFYRMAARELRAMTEFDRVMIYRFHHDGSGEVIAESVRSGLGSYLGLRYPGSDIPRQARMLYERNWLRLIADINAAPSVIESTLELGGSPLDLSRSVLRSVSPIHVEYLRNMGVSASMSVSILREDRLWGLFACHHYAPHLVSFGRRTAAELFGQMFSFLMENRERENESAYELRAQALHQQLVTTMATEGTQFESIVSHLDEIADLLACDGIGVWINDRGTLKGVTPSKSEFAELVGFLKSNNVIEIYARHDLGAQFPPARAFAERAAGVLVVPLSRPARDYLIFFRKEVARTVNWAGDPSKPVIVGRLDERLTPRKSFELWKETVHGQSPAWLSVECRIAEALRVSLLEVILHMSALAEDERTRAQQRQALLIDELNHRVRNILSLIRGIISQSKDPAHTIDSFTEAVGGRIQALARAHDQITADKWAPASFASMLKTEAGAYLTIGADRVNLKGIDVLIEPQAFTTVALVMHEMITNSAKYGALSDQRGRVDVRTSITAEGNLIIQWSEHGGPLVALPKRRGFGSTVIDSIRHDLQGEVELTYAPSGLHARFSIPQMHFRASNPHAGRRENHLGDRDEPAASVPRDVLLVEDTILIALDAEDMMRELGVESVRVTSNATQALSEIAARRPDFALLDVNLGDHKSFEVAERLAELGVRFAFGTGYGNEVRFPAVFASAPKLRKPYVANEIKQIFTTAS